MPRRSRLARGPARHWPRDRQTFRFRALGAEANPHLPVFDDGFAETMKPRTLRKAFGRMVRPASVNPIPFHCLRHAAATLMLREGVALHVVAKTIGHSDPATTLRYYAHVLEEMEGQASVALGRAYVLA